MGLVARALQSEVGTLSLLLEWKKRGSLRKDFDAHLFAEGWVALYDGMMVHLAIGTEASEIRKIFAGFIDAVEQGILRQ